MGEPRGFLVVPIGYNPSDDLRALELDASDNLKVVMGDTSLSALLTELGQKLETADLELITSVLSVGLHGWVGGAWQRNPLSLGYSGRVAETFSNLSAVAGDNNLPGNVVPAGEVWVLTNLSARNINTAVGQILFFHYNGSMYLDLASRVAPGLNIIASLHGTFILQPGDRVSAYFTGCTLNDDLYFSYMGYRVDIDQ